MSDENTPESGTNDVKEQFRLALERKNKQAHDAHGNGKHGESSHGETDTHAHGAKREFRRKSG